MKGIPIRTLVWLTLALLLFSLASRALADVDAFSLPWWSVDGGGGTSEGSVYFLRGTIGQPDAGGLSGGEYTLAGGFWGGRTSPALLSQRIFLPLTIK